MSDVLTKLIVTKRGLKAGLKSIQKQINRELLNRGLEAAKKDNDLLAYLQTDRRVSDE